MPTQYTALDSSVPKTTPCGVVLSTPYVSAFYGRTQYFAPDAQMNALPVEVFVA